MINVKVTERTGKVVAVLRVAEDDDMLIMTKKGMVIRVPMRSVRIIGRNTQGVKLISLSEGDRVVSVARVVSDGSKDEDDEEDGEAEAGSELPEAEAALDEAMPEEEEK